MTIIDKVINSVDNLLEYPRKWAGIDGETRNIELAQALGIQSGNYDHQVYKQYLENKRLPAVSIKKLTLSKSFRKAYKSQLIDTLVGSDINDVTIDIRRNGKTDLTDADWLKKTQKDFVYKTVGICGNISQNIINPHVEAFQQACGNAHAIRRDFMINVKTKTMRNGWQHPDTAMQVNAYLGLKHKDKIQSYSFPLLSATI